MFTKHRRSTEPSRYALLLCALLASTVLFAVTAATASALPEATAQWGSAKTGQPISPRNVEIQGQVTALNLGESGKVTCDATGTLALLPAGEGRVASLELDPETCSGTGILYSCQVQSAGALGDWPVRATKKGIVVGDVRMGVTFADQSGNGCFYEGGSFETEALSDWEAALTSPSMISKIASLQGAVAVHYPNGAEAFTSFSLGELKLAPQDADLYALVAPPFASFDPFWTQGGAVLEAAAETEAVGVIQFTNPEEGFGTISCEVAVDVSFTPGDTGSIDQMDVESCKGTSGLYAEILGPCEMIGGGAEALPYALTAKVGSVELEAGTPYISVKYDEGCFFQYIDLYGENLTLTPYDLGAISVFEVEGDGATLIHDLGGIELEAEVAGYLEMSEPGVYGIG
ncbi:MAG TPA: hypothetical protein VNP96_03090 [Solirubrobacterales bacterium]|nr:hypothetical protein [Solirubrobacterales bacterium]